MNLYLVTQDENTGYDTYDSFVCACETEGAARLMNPSNGCPMEEGDWSKSYGCWASHPVHVHVKYLGIADEGTERGLICTSFHAG